MSARQVIFGLDQRGPTFADGEVVDQWTCDEDGELRRALAFSRREFDAEQLRADAAMARDHLGLADLEWQVRMDRLDLDSIEAEAAREAAGEFAAALHEHSSFASPLQMEVAYAERERDAALGLVSVLSTLQGVKKARKPGAKPVPPSRPFRVLAEQAAAVQAAGAFIAGGDEARMAKLRRAVGFAARGHGATRQGHRPDEVRMVTLTLRDGVEWNSKMMALYMNRVRNWHNRVANVKCRYVWVAEIQDGKRRNDGGARGAVHYHVALWVPVGTPHMPKSDEAGWWPHGSTRTELAKGAVQYLMHYLKKGNAKNFGAFPDGCRIYSVGGLEHSMRRARRWLGLPGFVQANSSFADDWRRADGGGWTDPSGLHWPSEFRRINCGGLMALQRVHTHERSIDASGPFAWLSDRERLSIQFASH